MFSTISHLPESVSQPNSAVLNRFSSLQDSHHIAASPLSSLYNISSPTLTPTIAPPALPRVFSSQSNSPRIFSDNSRDGRTHVKSKICHGLGELLKVPSSPSDLIISPILNNSNYHNNNFDYSNDLSSASSSSTWTLKSPSSFTHRRSYTTTSSSVSDDRNQQPDIQQVPYFDFDHSPNFQNDTTQSYVQKITLPNEPSTSFSLVDNSSNVFYNGTETNHENLDLIPLASNCVESFSTNTNTQSNLSENNLDHHQHSIIKNTNIIPASKTNLGSTRMKSKKSTKSNPKGVHKINNNKDLNERKDSSGFPVITITAGGYARKYACNWEGCGKAFTTSGHLARHNRIHTGEKRYECLMSGCQSRFSRQDNMLQHYRTHLSGKCRRLPSVSSVTSSNEGGKKLSRSPRDKIESLSESSHESRDKIECLNQQSHESEPTTSNTRYEDFQGPMNETIEYTPNLSDHYHEPMISTPLSQISPNDVTMMYDNDQITSRLGNSIPHHFSSNYPPFDLHSAELTLESYDDLLHSHEIDSHLSSTRRFTSSSSNWPFDFNHQQLNQNQSILTSPPSDHETDVSSHTAFGHSFTCNLQYSLPSVP
ncbi:hypothetical protein CROQUDRAFT_100002 [Cronartium quercuum f. sp. fusiforme G11]|uniref:C2H2-type domain-containing protein n=1 Tax=Cronartium quercuum f. sp. fusiforme G11 TaxID=708437 RepID=A0A9P6T6K5_9BASI|nr:hypothetical protein CROQUDRAFT_100002 [Cronartium quercuum f. sp. fusiforme G11]